MSYNTKQKELILDIIKHKKGEFVVSDIYNDLNKEVGLTTIYRLIDSLVNDKVVSRTIKNNKPYYEYLEDCTLDNHFYLKCEGCSKLIHIDCDCINDLSNHIKKDHKFTLNNKNIIITGLCEKCKEGIYERSNNSNVLMMKKSF